MAPARNKLYAYVDETGQDTVGGLYLVAVVVAGEERDAVRRRLAEIERSSGKQGRKWAKSRPEERRRYIAQVLEVDALASHLYYSDYHNTHTYVDLSILSTAKAILAAGVEPFEATVFVDGLARSERRRFAAGLRRLHVTIRKVRGMRDESDEFIRSADAIAGFVRDAIEGDHVMSRILQEAAAAGRIRKV
jgi:hypothetical protein